MSVIVAGSIQMESGRGQIDDNAIDRAMIAAVDEGPLDAVNALFDGPFRQAHNDRLGHCAGRNIDLDFDGNCLDSEQRIGEELGEHEPVRDVRNCRRIGSSYCGGGTRRLQPSVAASCQLAEIRRMAFQDVRIKRRLVGRNCGWGVAERMCAGTAECCYSRTAWKAILRKEGGRGNFCAVAGK